MKFNEILLELRKQKGWSQEELGEKLNVSRQTISKYESGLSTPEMEKLIELSKVFEISIDQLVGTEKETVITDEKTKNKYVNLKDKTAYELIYNKSDGKYTYKNRLADFISEEETEEYFNNLTNNNQIKNITLSCIPNNFMAIITQSLNPLYKVSLFKNKIENYLINEDVKVRINLTKDGLIERYDMKTEYNNGLSMNFSYDYVQDHFENFNEIEPFEEYKDIIIFE